MLHEHAPPAGFTAAAVPGSPWSPQAIATQAQVAGQDVQRLHLKSLPSGEAAWRGWEDQRGPSPHTLVTLWKAAALSPSSLRKQAFRLMRAAAPSPADSRSPSSRRDVSAAETITKLSRHGAAAAPRAPRALIKGRTHREDQEPVCPTSEGSLCLSWC